MANVGLPVKPKIGQVKTASDKPVAVGPLFNTTIKDMKGLISKIGMLKENQDSPLSFKTKPGTRASLAIATGQHDDLQAGPLPKPEDLDVGNHPKVDKAKAAEAQKDSAEKVQVHDGPGLYCLVASTQDGQANNLNEGNGQLLKAEFTLV